jgi:REP element-mobilizing transposase RayT
MCSSNFKSSINIVYSYKDHLIGCTKYRRPVLVDAIAVRLDEIIRM